MTNLPSVPTRWSPPPNFQAVPSTVDGITIFAPLPEASKTEVPETFTCPNCGASTKYDVASGGVACEHCGFTAPIQAQTVGQRAEKFEFTLDTLKEAGQGWGVERKELHCDSCGATLTLAQAAITATCPFCASNHVNLRVAAADVLRPRFLIPFKLQPDRTRALSKQWLGQGWFHPSELAQSAGVDRFLGVYLPYWTFSASITSTWKAEVGYEEQERYYDASDKEWKTRTVIRWRWENGRVQGNVTDLLISGSSHASKIILERLLPFGLTDLVTYNPEYLAGWQAQAYDVTLPQAWEEGKAEIRERAKKSCYADIPTSHVRNFSMIADFDDEAWRYILLPVYVAAYRFEEKVYQVMVNGQTGVVAGQKPVAWWKIWLAIAALLAPGLFLGLIGVPLLFIAGAGIIVLGLALILLVIGGIFAFKIYRDAVASEAA